jgi:hypothetical protein
MYLPDGYIKANGATVQRADYPRLVALADAHNLWTSDLTTYPGGFGAGDGSTTMTLPNWTERMAQYTFNDTGEARAAGLPNLVGFLSIISGGYIPSAPFYDTMNKTVNHIKTDIQTGVDTTAISYAASRSNTIYGASATVQPPAINTMPIMRY